jgi:hypothetical protein
MNIESYIYKHLYNIGDILAIPFFILSIYYFYNINNRTFFEDLLLVFNIVACIADIVFTYIFLNEKIIKSYMYKHLYNIGDILAIPFFILSIYYFYNINNRTFFEDLLLVFNVMVCIIDILFTYIFLNEK